MELQKSTPRRAIDLVSPVMFVIILALIVGFIAAFLILRPAGGATRDTPTASSPQSQQ